MTTEYMIGTTLEDLTPLDELETPVEAPKSDFQPYSEIRQAGDGSFISRGSAIAIWNFPFLEFIEQRDQLKQFCPGASAEVYIRTRLADDTFATFVCWMVWPLREQRENSWKVGFQIQFHRLVEVEAS